MASVAMLSPPVKKEPDMLTRTTLLPKRKPVVAGVATRARFVKPRPNVSANKASKESLPPPSENAKADENVPSQPVETESETLQRPAIPRRAAAIPAPSRARFQRAKPNIGSLLNKSVKDAQKTEEKSVPTSDNTKSQDPPCPKVDVPDLSQTETRPEERHNSDSKFSPVTSSLHNENIIDKAPSVAESRQSPLPIIDEDSVCGNFQEFSSIRTTPDEQNLESHTGKRLYSNSTIRDSATETSSSHNIESALTSPRAAEIAPEKESPTASTVINKSTEYPTLKSILNSPRKRTATKKVHERRKRVANFSSTPSRSEMTMVDLIYWNPSSSPMKEVKPRQPAEEELLPVDDPPPAVEEETDGCSVGPKVIINDDGEIILDESSLFVRRKNTVDYSVPAIVENENTTYSSFRNRSFRTWSKRETAKFYKALSLVGTDFALMENLFREDGKVTRTRRELKLKFKREEKSNPKFVHIAMYELQTYDLNMLDDDQDIAELLDESELIDDAPKAAKRSGTKTTGKRGRKKKSDLTEAIVDENTSESILEAENESRETSDSLSDETVQRNKKDIESNSKPAVLRPERARKAKILSDYVTDVDELSDENDYLDNEGETLPFKKRKRPQVLSEEEDASTEALDNNGSVIDGDNTSQKGLSSEEIDSYIAGETDDTGNEKSGAVPIKKRRKLQTLPKIIEENSEVYDLLSDLMPETSRSGRKIKAKKMTDFITDPDALTDSDDESNPVEELQDLHEVNIISHEETAENLNAVGSICQLSDSTQLEGEFSIIPPVEADGENPENHNVILTLDVENPDGNGLVIESSDVMAQSELNDTEELIRATQTISSTEALASSVSSDEPVIVDSINLQDSEICEDIDANNILTDAAITEVVVTSDLAPRRTRKKVLPNVAKGSKRPPIRPLIQKKAPLPSRRTSFNSFTPVEEPQIIPKITCVETTKTYLKQTGSKPIKLEKESDMPEYLETVLKSPVNISRKRSLSGPAMSPCTPEMSVSRTNSMCTPTRSPLTNTPVNVFSQSPNVPQSSIELPLNASTADPKTINMTPENYTDNSPMVILTRTPNNSNMLHLFLYQKS